MKPPELPYSPGKGFETFRPWVKDYFVVFHPTCEMGKTVAVRQDAAIFGPRA